MTECERLIEEKKLDPSFLKEEIRCDYLVTTKMKKVWAISIDLLLKVHEICQQYSLKYITIAGTTLGAIRHNGFIPWDDDLDIAMPRRDYDIFVEIASKSLSEPYFLQSCLTDKDYYNRPFVRLRNSYSTGISRNDERKKINNGIFIDIFPLDGYEYNGKCNRMIKNSKFKSSLAWNYYHYNEVKNHKIIRWLIRQISPILLPKNPEFFYKKHEDKCRYFSSKYKENIGIQYAFYRGDKKRWIWKKNLIDEIIWVDFEYIKIPIPKQYDVFLKTIYGNYMLFPPIDERGKFHDVEFEPDLDYKSYCHIKYGVNY